MTISDPKKFCASARSQTPASRYPGKHHIARLPRHLIAVTLSSWSLTQDITGSSPFSDNYFYHPQTKFAKVLTDIPPGQTPQGRHPSGQTPPGQIPPWADTLLGIHTPAQCMLGYSQQVRGTHPTGMHSCLFLNSLNSVKTFSKNSIVYFILLIIEWLRNRTNFHKLF